MVSAVPAVTPFGVKYSLGNECPDGPLPVVPTHQKGIFKLRILDMADGITFSVSGTPRGQPRHRGRGRPVSIINPTIKLWAVAVERAAKAAGEAVGWPEWISAAVRVDMLLQFPTGRAERWGALHTPKPDKDNCEKLVLDAMERAGLLPKGDSRVSRGEPVKVWAEHGRLVVTMRPGVAPALPQGQPPAWLV